VKMRPRRWWADINGGFYRPFGSRDAAVTWIQSARQIRPSVGYVVIRHPSERTGSRKLFDGWEAVYAAKDSLTRGSAIKTSAATSPEGK
jgi:hypothetical protein